ncbi:MAG: hypothetical protein KBA61_04285 [Spirochaetes bacterium]|nr:hypothetical protein [Spirochaetota bacterium]
MKKLFFFIAAAAILVSPPLRGENGGTPADNEAGESVGSPFNQSKFVPDISLILDASYVYRNTRDGEYEKLHTPAITLVPAEEERHGHEEPYLRNGFNFNYAEITFFSIVDPYLELFAVCHLAEEHFGLEEAYFTTRSLPFGFQLRAGKFLSGFGRINEQHAHYWDFADQTLAYNAFFGEEGLGEVGARLTWVAPIDFYLMLGGEVLQGGNARSFGNGKILHADGTTVEDGSNGPNLGVGYVKTSFDIGELTVLAGASGAFGNARINHGLDRSGKSGNAFTGDTYVLGGDITLKYMMDSVRFVTLQAEYLFRRMEGDIHCNDASDVMTRSDLEKRQSGLYTQLVAKFSRRWRCGARYDLLQMNRVEEDGMEADLPENMPRYSGMLEYNPTEFSRFRVQYNFDASRYGTETGAYEKKTNHEVIVQANLAIGAHGAHSF